MAGNECLNCTCSVFYRIVLVAILRRVKCIYSFDKNKQENSNLYYDCMKLHAFVHVSFRVDFYIPWQCFQHEGRKSASESESISIQSTSIEWIQEQNPTKQRATQLPTESPSDRKLMAVAR